MKSLPTKEEIIQKACETGRCSREQYEAVYDAIQTHRPQTGLIVGVHTGGMAIVMTATIPTMFCCDTWPNDSDRQQFVKHVHDFMLERCFVSRRSSREFLKGSNQVDIAFLDGDHSYDGFKADIEDCLALGCKLIICHPQAAFQT